MKVAIGSDHGGVELKAELVKALSSAYEMTDFGPADTTSCDYPDYAIAVAKAVASGTADFGILICRSGIGMSMTANRFQNVRAAICANVETAKVTRQHNGANVLCLGADAVAADLALEIAKSFLSTPVDESERHARRRWKIERAQRLSDCSGLMHDDPEVFAAIEAQTKQEDAEINLIASENTSSRACREAAGSVLIRVFQRLMREQNERPRRGFRYDLAKPRKLVRIVKDPGVIARLRVPAVVAVQAREADPAALEAPVNRKFRENLFVWDGRAVVIPDDLPERDLKPVANDFLVPREVLLRPVPRARVHGGHGDQVARQRDKRRPGVERVHVLYEAFSFEFVRHSQRTDLHLAGVKVRRVQEEKSVRIIRRPADFPTNSLKIKIGGVRSGPKFTRRREGQAGSEARGEK